MRYLLLPLLLALAGCTTTPASKPEYQATHLIEREYVPPVVTSQRVEDLKAAELQLIGALLAYDSLEELDASYLSIRVGDALDDLRSKSDAPDKEFLEAKYYYNYAVQELLNYVTEQKSSK